jgi:hypothetical protein
VRNNEGVNVKLLKKKKKRGGCCISTGLLVKVSVGYSFLCLHGGWNVQLHVTHSCYLTWFSALVFLPSFSRAQGMQLLLSWANGASLEKAASPIALACTTLPSENQG